MPKKFIKNQESNEFIYERKTRKELRRNWKALRKKLWKKLERNWEVNEPTRVPLDFSPDFQLFLAENF